MLLETELRFYEEHREELLKRYRGLFVLIKGQELIGAFPDAQSAHRAGVARFGMEPFLIKQVLESEPIAIAPISSLVIARAGL